MKLIDVQQTRLLEAPNDEFLDDFLSAGWRIIETVKHQTREKDGTTKEVVEFILGAKEDAKLPQSYQNKLDWINEDHAKKRGLSKRAR